MTKTLTVLKKITILTLISVICTIINVHAYDFCANGPDGRPMYFNRISDTEAELTYRQQFVATDSYSGPVEVPSTVKDDHQMYHVTAIGQRAFFGCRNLMSVTMPETIKKIGMWAFAWCDALMEINVPQSVDAIGANAFEGCYNLTAIVTENNDNYTHQIGVLYDKSQKSLLTYPAGRMGVYSVPEGTETIGKNAFAGCTFLTSVEIPESVVTIADNAFYFCNGLAQITIPASVTSIGTSALSDCFNLQSIDVDAENTAYASEDGVLYDISHSTLIQSPGAQSGLAAIAEGTKEIAEQAFFRNMGVTAVQMPATVRKVGPAAFIDCQRLTTVQLSDSVTEIADMAFAMCPSLEGIYTRVADPKSIRMGEGVFAQSPTESCTLYVPEASMDLYAKADQWSELNIQPIEALKAQTIEWIQQPTDTLSVGTRIPLNASASSGLPVRYSIAPSGMHCVEASESEITITAPGIIKITAYQPGDSEYLPATPVTIVIDKVTGIHDVMMPEADIRVYGGRGEIIITGADTDTPIDVYDINGVKIYSGTNQTIRVQSNQIYIVRISGATYKVGVR